MRTSKGTSIKDLTFEKHNENITAPVYKGDILGSIEIKNGQQSLGKVDLIATRTVEQKLSQIRQVKHLIIPQKITS